MGVGCVRAQEAKDAVVKLSVLSFIDFGDGVVPTNYMFQQMTLRVLADIEEVLRAIDQTTEL